MDLVDLLNARQIDLQAFPGRGGLAPAKGRPRKAMRFRRLSLVMVAAAERGLNHERFGLGSFLLVRGPSVLRCGIIVGDDIGRRRPGQLEELEAWANRHVVPTPIGGREIEVVTLSGFCHPHHGLFWKTVYTGAGFLVTADLGRLLGLLADRWRPARGPFDGGWAFYLPGCWEIERAKGRARLRSVPHRPAIRCKALGPMAYVAQFMRARPRGGGKYVGRTPFGGRFFDVIPAAFGLDPMDSPDLADHLREWDIDPGLDLPAAVPVDSNGAASLLQVVNAVHALAVAIDAEASRWLGGYLDPTALTSPGSLMTAMLRSS